MGVASAVLAQPLVVTVFGAKWADSAPVLSVLAWYGILFSFSLLFANVLVALGKTLRLLLVQVAWVAILVPTMIVGLRMLGLQGVAWAHVLTIALIAVPAYLFVALRSTRLRLSQLLVVIVRPAVGAAVAGAGAWLICQFVSTPILQLVVGGLSGLVLYLLVIAPLAARMLPQRWVPGWVPARWRAVEDGARVTRPA